MALRSGTTDAELIALLRQGTIEENNALTAIYKAHYTTVAGYVLRNSGDHDAARDVFQDGVIVLYRNIKGNKFNGESSLGTYLFSICRFLWLKTLKKHGHSPLDQAELDLPGEEPLMTLLDDERRKAVLTLFDRLGEVCKRILLLSYYDDLDMREIAERTGFKDEQNARNKKYKCLKSLKTMMEEQGGMAHWLETLRPNTPR